MERQHIPAHIRIDGNSKIEQPNRDHCLGTARLASEDLASVQLSRAAYLAGLSHDLGKGTLFKDYITRLTDGEPVRRGSVNHTFGGCRYILERYHGPDPRQLEDMAAELIAYAVGAHHGLFDIVNEEGKNGFLHRIAAKPPDYDEAVSLFTSQCASPQEIDGLFQEATAELIGKLQLLSQLDGCDGTDFSFYGGLLARLLLSAVIDGDRRDTAAFMTGVSPPSFPDDMTPIWRDRLAFLEEKLAGFSQDSPIARARRRLSQQCAKLGDKPTGIYRLTLPTGAGKTLGSLRAALAHAAAHNKSRIIFTIPLLSVLDQNSQILHEYLGDDSLILEHHSNLIRESSAGEGEDLDKKELLTENWRSPLVITTLVQLLNTLFDGRTGCVRRMQALANSVLVIDEVQTVPPRFLTLFNLALNFLVTACNVTVLLCSATQPCLDAAKHPLAHTPEELVPYDPALWRVFQRTTLQEAESRRLDEIGGFLLSQLKENLLCVCNTKAEAAHIFRQLVGVERYHLSASMCMAHRRDTLSAIKVAKETHRRFICVSTQVIEAGVDISFGQAVRLMAGLDNIIQTAGRCNRNGEDPNPVPVLLLPCADEWLGRLPDIQQARAATESLIEAFRHDPAPFGTLSSDAAIDYYYRHFYANMKEDAQDGPQGEVPTLFELLSDNKSYAAKDPQVAYCWLRQAFATAGAHFRVFESDTYDVLVPYGAGAEIMADFCSERARHDLSYKAALLERAKPYTVSLWEYQKRQLEQVGGLVKENDILMLREPFYDNALGVVTDGGTMELFEL